MEEKINVTELVKQIQSALADEFVAQIKRDGNTLTLEFSNGQSFSVRVTEGEE